MTALPVVPGVPAAGHVANGFWHPGRIEDCSRCERDDAWERAIETIRAARDAVRGTR